MRGADLLGAPPQASPAVLLGAVERLVGILILARHPRLQAEGGLDHVRRDHAAARAASMNGRRLGTLLAEHRQFGAMLVPPLADRLGLDVWVLASADRSNCRDAGRLGGELGPQVRHGGSDYVLARRGGWASVAADLLIERGSQAGRLLVVQFVG